jgi:hypothetical protein
LSVNESVTASVLFLGNWGARWVSMKKIRRVKFEVAHGGDVVRVSASFPSLMRKLCRNTVCGARFGGSYGCDLHQLCLPQTQSGAVGGRAPRHWQRPTWKSAGLLATCGSAVADLRRGSVEERPVPTLGSPRRVALPAVLPCATGSGGGN